MVGEIGTREFLLHAPAIARDFGAYILLRCIISVVMAEPTTFLMLVMHPSIADLLRELFAEEPLN